MNFFLDLWTMKSSEIFTHKERLYFAHKIFFPELSTSYIMRKKFVAFWKKVSYSSPKFQEFFSRALNDEIFQNFYTWRKVIIHAQGIFFGIFHFPHNKKKIPQILGKGVPLFKISRIFFPTSGLQNFLKFLHIKIHRNPRIRIFFRNIPLPSWREKNSRNSERTWPLILFDSTTFIPTESSNQPKPFFSIQGQRGRGGGTRQCR